MKGLFVICIAATPAAFVLGDLYVANLMELSDSMLDKLADAVFTLPAYIASGNGLSSEPLAICIGFLLVCAIWIAYARYLFATNGKRTGEEHGSARWATMAEMKKFRDAKNEDNNIILTRNCRIALNDSEKSKARYINKNVQVIGGSGSGKTRNHVIPNLMQMNANYFVVDPKATIIEQVRSLLESNEYKVLHFSTIDFANSNHYNPLAYVRTQSDILCFVECLIKNTTGDRRHSNDQFWENAERLLYCALIGYLVFHCPKSQRNMPGLLRLLSMAGAKEYDENYMSGLDLTFMQIQTGYKYAPLRTKRAKPDPEERVFIDDIRAWHWIDVGDPTDPEDDFALSNYLAFKSAAGKTLKSILISCNVRCRPLGIKEVSDILSEDELEIDKLGDAGEKRIIFASMSDTNSTYDFLFSILIWQTVNILCETALTCYGGALPEHVTLMLDEFANAGFIPDFEKTIAVIRSRNISSHIILQSISQLESVYDKNRAKVITDNCDITLFLGGKSTDTNEEVSKMIGKQTITNLNLTDSKSSQTSKSYVLAGRDLMQASEISRLDRDSAIALISGNFPIKDKKFDLESHKRYREMIKPSKLEEPADKTDSVPDREAPS
ncbi:MAG: type IV secretory system conjugative DNA transfer family protein [Eggerthellaceae bacterium]|nr:type IV secretory system conjugative DNA transfer family protein [Eggerthellaceae bacterium]